MRAPPDPRPGGLTVLYAVLVAQLSGLALTALREGTAIGSWLFLSLRWSEQASVALERAGAALAAAGCVLAAALWRHPAAQRWAAIAASAWFAFLALAEWRMGGAPFTQWSVPAHAARIAAPLLLAVWRDPALARGLARGAIALTFFAHGLEALLLHPAFVDYLLAADLRLAGFGLTQAQAEVLLRAIGAVDVLVAVLVASGVRWAPLFAWAAAWGLVTALSRVVQGGEGALHQALIRAANGGLPLLLLAMSASPAASASSLLRRRSTGAFLSGLLLVLPLTADAQAFDGPKPAHLRMVWTEDPSHRATVAWSSISAGGTHAVYFDTEPRGGALTDYGKKTEATSGEYQSGGPYFHQAQLTGLLPATRYYFVVVSDGHASPERHFVTAPADDRAFRLLFGGDARTGIVERRKMNQLIARLVEEDPGIVALAHGGDYVESGTRWSDWNSWLEDHALTFTAAGRVLPIIPARGNHEGDAVVFNRVFGFPGGPEVDYFAVQLGAGATLITLDTNDTMGGDQKDWLERQLRAARARRWIVASYHQPAYPAFKSAGAARRFWVPLFEQYDVDVVCESDGHVLKRTVPIRSERADPTGVVYVGEGGLGVPQRTPDADRWYLQPPGMARSGHHVQVFSFSPTELVYEARWMDGSVADRYVFKPRR